MRLRCLNIVTILSATILLAGTSVRAQDREDKYFADFFVQDDELNRVYKRLLSRLDKEGTDNLRAAQRAWIDYRMKEAVLRRFVDGGNEGSSSIRAPALNDALVELTKERISVLRGFLKSLEDR